MSTQRIIQCIGTNEEDTAHLRLLVRVTRTQVRDSWAWGAESRADLVVVDTRRLVGSSALRRAAQRAVACAQVIDVNDQTPAGLFLRRPFQREAFARLLNKVGSGAAVVQEVDAWSDEFTDLDLGKVDLSALEAEHPGARAGPARRNTSGGTQASVDPMRSGDPLVTQSGLPIADRPEAGGESDRAGEGVPATTADQAAKSAADQKPAEDVTDPSSGSDVEPDIDKDATYPLIHYLQKGVLRGPARITLRGLPALLLDPDEQFFWAKGLLPALEPYARELLRFGDWQRLSRAELVQARSGIAARPCARLVWMYAFVHSNGFLAKHFDPGGNFLLTNRLDFTLDYPRAVRVGALLITPRKLHEIARMTGVGLAEVFDIINAYEAVGYVEWTPRENTPR